LGAAIPPAKRYLGETDQTDYSPLVIGRNYFIFALIFICDRIDFLVCPKNELPLWVPASLFELSDRDLPEGWRVCDTRGSKGYEMLFENFGITYIFGYPLITRNYQHYIGLIERDPVALAEFSKEMEKVEDSDVEALA
jgi:hypothetical protein